VLHASLGWALPLQRRDGGAPLAVTAFTGRWKETGRRAETRRDSDWERERAWWTDCMDVSLPLSVASILLRTAGLNGPPSGSHGSPCWSVPWRNGLHLFFCFSPSLRPPMGSIILSLALLCSYNILLLVYQKSRALRLKKLKGN